MGRIPTSVLGNLSVRLFKLTVQAIGAYQISSFTGIAGSDLGRLGNENTLTNIGQFLAT
jgi:hypothetical protein